MTAYDDARAALIAALSDSGVPGRATPAALRQRLVALGDALAAAAADAVYTLPVASGSVLGGVKQGANITIGSDGTISASDGPDARIPSSGLTVGRLARYTAANGTMGQSGVYDDGLGNLRGCLSIGVGTASVRGLQEWSGTNPSMVVTNTAAPVDHRTWDWFFGSGGTLVGRALNDAFSAAGNWVVVARSGVTIASVQFPAVIVASSGVQFSDSSLQTTASPVRAWANINGATGALRASSGIATVTRVSAGHYTVTLAAAQADANYIVKCSVSGAYGSLTHCVALPHTNGTSEVAPTTTTFSVYCQNGGSAGPYDPKYLFIEVSR